MKAIQLLVIVAILAMMAVGVNDLALWWGSHHRGILYPLYAFCYPSWWRAT